VWGLLKLAENAILAQNPPEPPTGYPGYAAAPGATTYTGVVPGDASSSTAVAPPQNPATQDEERR